MLRQLGVLTLCFVVLAISPPSAMADEEMAKPTTAVARDRLTAGTRLYRVREFEKAIEEYKAGALAEDAPVFYYNLGQCYRQLGKYDDAIWHYQRFLDRATTAPEKYRQAATTFIRDMKAELEKRAMTKQPTEPAPDGKLVDESQTEKTTDAAGTNQLHIVPQDSAEALPAPWYADRLGWGISGIGIAASGVAVYMLVDARSLQDDANNEPTEAARAALNDRAANRRLGGTIVGALGIAALATGIVKLAMTDQRSETRATALDIGVSSNGLVVTGRF